MKRSELKSGMLIQNLDGKIGMVLLGTSHGDIIAGQNGSKGETWFPLANIANNLSKENIKNSYRIVKVWDIDSNMCAASFKTSNRPVIWEMNSVQLNDKYHAIINNDGTVEVGCQKFSKEVIKELIRRYES